MGYNLCALPGPPGLSAAAMPSGDPPVGATSSSRRRARIRSAAIRGIWPAPAFLPPPPHTVYVDRETIKHKYIVITLPPLDVSEKLSTSHNVETPGVPDTSVMTECSSSGAVAAAPLPVAHQSRQELPLGDEDGKHGHGGADERFHDGQAFDMKASLALAMSESVPITGGSSNHAASPPRSTSPAPEGRMPAVRGEKTESVPLSLGCNNRFQSLLELKEQLLDDIVDAEDIFAPQKDIDRLHLLLQLVMASIEDSAQA